MPSMIGIEADEVQFDEVESIWVRYHKCLLMLYLEIKMNMCIPIILNSWKSGFIKSQR